MSPREAEPAYPLDVASKIKSVSVKTLRRAINATDGNVLRAKKVGNSYRVAASELDRWFDALEDA